MSPRTGIHESHVVGDFIVFLFDQKSTSRFKHLNYDPLKVYVEFFVVRVLNHNADRPWGQHRTIYRFKAALEPDKICRHPRRVVVFRSSGPVIHDTTH